MTKIVIMCGAMTDVASILAAAGTRTEIADECGVKPIAVYRWERNGSVPAKYWGGILRVAARNKADVTADLLCRAHDLSTSRAPQQKGAT